MKWAYPRKSTEEHHSVGNMWMQMSKKKSSFCYMMDGKEVLQLPLYPPSHGTFRPFQMYCLVFGLLLVSRLLQYFKPQKFDTYSHVKHQSKQCMKASFNLKYFLDANVSVSHKLCKQENFRICWKVEVVFWFNCTHVMVVAVGQSTILNEMNSQCDKETMDQVVNH